MFRASWCEETPFLKAEYIQRAGSHLESAIGESSKIVPFLTVNSYLQALQRHKERDETKPNSLASQRMHRTPFGQRSPATKSRQTASSEKYRIAPMRVSGNFAMSRMVPQSVCQVYRCPS